MPGWLTQYPLGEVGSVSVGTAVTQAIAYYNDYLYDPLQQKCVRSDYFSVVPIGPPGVQPGRPGASVGAGALRKQ